MALAEARIELARERGQGELVRSELLRILQVRRSYVEYLEGRIATTTKEVDLADARVALLKAEVRLLREQKKRG